MLDGEGLASVEDLRAFFVEQLEELQEVLQTADTNPLVGFYDGERHVDENTARNLWKRKGSGTHNFSKQLRPSWTSDTRAIMMPRSRGCIWCFGTTREPR